MSSFMEDTQYLLSVDFVQSSLIASALLEILIGVVVIVVAIGLLRGNNASRIVITIFQILSIVGSVFLAIAYPAGAIGAQDHPELLVVLLGDTEQIGDHQRGERL